MTQPRITTTDARLADAARQLADLERFAQYRHRCEFMGIGAMRLADWITEGRPVGPDPDDWA